MRENVPNCVRRLHAAKLALRGRRPGNELFCFSDAFEECASALQEIGDVRTLDPGADQSLAIIRATIDCSDIVVWDERGRTFARAGQLTPVELAAFEDAVHRLHRFLKSAAGRRYLRAAAQERVPRNAA